MTSKYSFVPRIASTFAASNNKSNKLNLEIMRHKDTGKRFTREDHLKRFKEVFGEEPPFDIKYMTVQQFSEFAMAHKEHVFKYINEKRRQNVSTPTN